MTEAQRQFIQRLQGYSAECGVGATKLRRRTIGQELRQDIDSGLAPNFVYVPSFIVAYTTRGRRAALKTLFRGFALSCEQLWPQEVHMARLGWPVEGGPNLHPITRSSQEHVDFEEKPAIDFGDPGILGATTIASFPGTVRTAAYDGGQYGAGWIVEIEGDVEGVSHVIAGYCHHGTDEDGGLLVAAGDWVEQGQALGPVGYSGWTIPAGERGAHLHWKLIVDGVRVDPAPFLVEA